MVGIAGIKNGARANPARHLELHLRNRRLGEENRLHGRQPFSGLGAVRSSALGEIRTPAGALPPHRLDRGLGQSTPLMILSGNSIEHALVMYGAMLAGVPVVPVSPAYSTMSTDFEKLK